MDPTYDIEEIKKNPAWHIAFILSEQYNDRAPIGWSMYIRVAEAALAIAHPTKGQYARNQYMKRS